MQQPANERVPEAHRIGCYHCHCPSHKPHASPTVRIEQQRLGRGFDVIVKIERVNPGRVCIFKIGVNVGGRLWLVGTVDPGAAEKEHDHCQWLEEKSHAHDVMQ